MPRRHVGTSYRPSQRPPPAHVFRLRHTQSFRTPLRRRRRRRYRHNNHDHGESAGRKRRTLMRPRSEIKQQVHSRGRRTLRVTAPRSARIAPVRRNTAARASRRTTPTLINAMRARRQQCAPRRYREMNNEVRDGERPPFPYASGRRQI